MVCSKDANEHPRKVYADLDAVQTAVVSSSLGKAIIHTYKVIMKCIKSIFTRTRFARRSHRAYNRGTSGAPYHNAMGISRSKYSAHL